MTRFGLAKLGEDDWKKWSVFRSRHRSSPAYQFRDWVEAEVDKLLQMPDSNPHKNLVSLFDADSECGSYKNKLGPRALLLQARLNVKKDWQSLGIWRPNFEDFMNGELGDGGWTHQVVPRASRNTSRVRASSTLMLDIRKRAITEKQIDNSRPINMFLHQLAKTRRDFMLAEPRRDNGVTFQGSSTLFTLVYEIVRADWERRGIWIHTWGDLPRDTWAHEIPVPYWYAHVNSRRALSGKDSSGGRKGTAQGGMMEKYRQRVKGAQRRTVSHFGNTEATTQNEATDGTTEKAESGYPKFSPDMHGAGRLQNRLQEENWPAAEPEPNSVRGSTDRLADTPSPDGQPEPFEASSAGGRIVDRKGCEREVSMCLGHDCAAHSLFADDNLDPLGSTNSRDVRMPGIFPGSAEQYTSLAQ